MDYTEWVDIKPLEKCTLQQACEFIAFKWTPTDKFTDETLKRPLIRAQAQENNNPEWEKPIGDALERLTYLLKTHRLVASGKEKTKAIEEIPLSADCVVNIESNTIKDGKHIYTDIELNFYDLQTILKCATPYMRYTLSLEDNNIFLTVNDNAIKILVKHLHNDAKNSKIIRRIMKSPNKTFERSAFKGIDAFDTTIDRLDNIVSGAIPNDVYKLFFTCTSDSAKFSPNATDIDLKKHNIKTLTII